jgi:chromosome segregation ATPase
VTDQKTTVEELHSQAQAEVTVLKTQNASLEDQAAASQTTLENVEARFSDLEERANQLDQSLTTVTSEKGD